MRDDIRHAHERLGLAEAFLREAIHDALHPLMVRQVLTPEDRERYVEDSLTALRQSFIEIRTKLDELDRKLGSSGPPPES